MRINAIIYTLATIAVIALLVESRMSLSKEDEACAVGYVYDGDTVELLCGGEKFKARLVGFDTPETRDARCQREREKGIEATQTLRRILTKGDIAIRQLGVDKYHRKLVRIWVDGVDVGEKLIDLNLAVPYFGGARISWCDGVLQSSI